MAEQLVIIDVDQNGDFTLETSGFQGKGCKDVAKAFEKMGKVNTEKNKDEFYKSPNNATVQVGG